MLNINNLVKSTAVLCAAATLVACGGSSDSADSSGFFKFYNASSNSPAIYTELGDADYPAVSFGNSTYLYEVALDDYDFSLSWQQSSDDFYTFVEQTVAIEKDQISLLVLAGDIDNPQMISYQFEDEDIDSDEEQFGSRVLNVHADEQAVDLYMARSDQTFNEAQLVSSASFGQLSDVQLWDLESYQFFITDAGSDQLLYQSEEITFSYTSHYVFVVRENIGPGGSNYVLDVLNKTGGVVSYDDKDSDAQIRFYNGLSPHELLPQFEDEITLGLAGNNDELSIDVLARGQFSEPQPIEFGDYALDIAAVGDDIPFADNYLLSMAANTDSTVFVYHREEEVEDEQTEELETELYVNVVAVENSQRISLYDHQIKVINLVDDFSRLSVYFVRNNETVETANYKVETSTASPRVITLPNNSYDVSVLGSENQSDLLLAFDQISLDSDSGDLFMILEEDGLGGYSVSWRQQKPE